MNLTEDEKARRRELAHEVQTWRRIRKAIADSMPVIREIIASSTREEVMDEVLGVDPRTL